MYHKARGLHSDAALPGMQAFWFGEEEQRKKV
jgi:hypothetical protein